MTLLELFDKTFPWRKTAYNFAYNGLPDWVAEFYTDDHKKYEIDIRPDESERRKIEVSFKLDQDNASPFAISGTGNAFQVLATVREVMQRYCDAFEPEIVAFEADGSQPSRIKLYSRMVADIHGYTAEISHDEFDGKAIFRLMRNNSTDENY